jgi:hypothetical protein
MFDFNEGDELEVVPPVASVLCMGTNGDCLLAGSVCSMEMICE